MDALAPGLNWIPYPLSAPAPPSTHIPLAVTELVSESKPRPASSQTAFFTLALIPPVPLEVGMAVHLYLLCARQPGAVLPRDVGHAIAVPLRIAGRIAGERTRREPSDDGPGTVEFLVKNDIPEHLDAPIRAAHVCLRAVPGVSVRADTVSPALVARLRPIAHARAAVEGHLVHEERRLPYSTLAHSVAGPSCQAPPLPQPQPRPRSQAQPQADGGQRTKDPRPRPRPPLAHSAQLSSRVENTTNGARGQGGMPPPRPPPISSDCVRAMKQQREPGYRSELVDWRGGSSVDRRQAKP